MESSQKAARGAELFCNKNTGFVQKVPNKKDGNREKKIYCKKRKEKLQNLVLKRNCASDFLSENSIYG